MVEPPKKSSPLDLGLADILGLGSESATTASSPKSDQSDCAPSDTLDLYLQLAEQKKWSEIEQMTQAQFNSSNLREGVVARLWWTRAMFEQNSMPVTILLAPLEEVLLKNAVPIDPSLHQARKMLAQRFAEEGHAEAAQIVGGEDFAAIKKVENQKSEHAAELPKKEQQKQSGVKNSLFIVLILGLVVVYYVITAPQPGSIAQVPVEGAVSKDNLRSPALPEPIAGSELATLLLRMDQTTSSNSSSPAVVPSKTAFPPTSSIMGTKKAILNMDGPLEPESVVKALAEGDVSVERDTGQILFGRSQQPLKGPSPAALEIFPRLLTMRALTRALITQEPTFSSAVIGRLMPGSTVLADGKIDSWLRVRLPNGTGYVLTQDLERVN